MIKLPLISKPNMIESRTELAEIEYEVSRYQNKNNVFKHINFILLLFQTFVTKFQLLIYSVTAWDIKLGGVRLDVGESGQYYQKSTRGIIHPNYNSYLNNDIALIELPIPVTQTSKYFYSCD